MISIMKCRSEGKNDDVFRKREIESFEPIWLIHISPPLHHLHLHLFLNTHLTMSMIRQSIRPVSRTVLRTPSRQVRFGSSSSPTSPKQSSNPIIPLLGIGAIVIGGIAYFYVPFKHDLKDRASDAVKGEAKPSTLKAISTQTDVRKSVLDQDSLKEPLHRRGRGFFLFETVKAVGSPTASSGATPSPAEKKGASNLPLEDKVPKVPETIEAKAEEAKAPAQTAFNEETGEINWDCPVSTDHSGRPCAYSTVPRWNGRRSMW